MISTLGAFLLLAAQSPQAPNWPAVTGAKVSRNALRPAEEPPAKPPASAPLHPPIDQDVYQADLKSAPKGRTLEFLLLHDPSAIVNYGNQQFIFQKGRLSRVTRNTFPQPEAQAPFAYDIAFVQRDKKVSVYSDGALVFTFAAPAVAPFEVRTGGGSLAVSAVYPRALTAAELSKNAKAGRAYLEAKLPESRLVTLDLTLGAFTPVPEPARIKPYRNALIAQEYTVTSVVYGRMKGLKPGTKVRVFRYGVLDGAKTDIQKQMAGERVRLTLQPLAANEAMQREYQLDELDSDYAIPYFVEARP